MSDRCQSCQRGFSVLLQSRQTKQGRRRRHECTQCGARWSTIEILDTLLEEHHAALATARHKGIEAAVREAGLDTGGLLVAVFALDATASTRRDFERASGGTQAGRAITDQIERTAALLRALAGIADGQTANEKGRAQS